MGLRRLRRIGEASESDRKSDSREGVRSEAVRSTGARPGRDECTVDVSDSGEDCEV